MCCFVRTRWRSAQHVAVEVFAILYAKLAKGLGKVAFDSVQRQAQVIGDFLVGPAVGGEHTDGKFGGAEVVGHVFAGDGVVHLAPAGGETIGDVDDALEVVGPARIDDGFEHAAEQAVVLAKAFDEVVRLGDVPGGEQVVFGQGQVFQGDGVHHRDEVQVNGRDGVGVRLNGKGRFHDAKALGVVALEVGVVCLHIEGKLAQPRRQVAQGVAEVVGASQRRQVQQHSCRGDDKDGGGVQPRRGGDGRIVEAGAHLFQGAAHAMGLTQGEVGVGVDQAGRQAQRRIGMGKIQLGGAGSLFGMAAEIVKFGQGNVAQVLVGDGFDGVEAVAWDKGGVHQWHGQVGSVRRRRCVGRNVPAVGALDSAGQAPALAETHEPIRSAVPLGCCLLHSDVSHDDVLLYVMVAFIIPFFENRRKRSACPATKKTPPRWRGCWVMRLEFEVVDTVLEDRLDLVARNVLGDVGANAFAVTHFAEDAAVWAGEPFDGGIGPVDVVWHVEAGVAVHVDILGNHLVVGKEAFEGVFTGNEAPFPM